MIKLPRWIVYCLMAVAACGSQHAGAQLPPALPDTTNTLPVLEAADEAAGGIQTAASPAWRAREKALQARLEELQHRLQAGQIPADPRNLPLVRLKLEQVGLWLEQARRESWMPEMMLRLGEAAADRAAAAGAARGDAVYPAPTPMHERAYIANDGSVQPYWIFVPNGYSPRRSYPLVVFLHGYDPALSKIEPWIPSENTWRLFTDRGYILAVPYGRRNSDFVDVGEDDTLEVTRLVSERYAVDRDRVFLLGPSMGGYGVYAVGLHHPHIWAGLATMAARSDFYRWFKITRESLPPWKRLLYDADDPRYLARNALHLPIYMQHGAQDTIVDVEHSRSFFRDLQGLKYPVRYRELSQGSHFIYWDDETYLSILQWLQGLRRPAPPRRVVYRTAALRNNRAYWVTINGFEDYARGAAVEAEIKDTNRLEVRLDNVAAFTLEPPADYLQAGQPITLEVNGTAVPAEGLVTGGTQAEPLRLQWPPPARENATTESPAAESRAAYPGVKTPGRSGPIKVCYRAPFLLVYGTSGLAGKKGPGPDEILARRFQAEWDAYADGRPPLKADREVTAADEARYNLVLFGTRRTNLVLARVPALPVELEGDSYRMGSEVIKGRNLGLQLCYPSPFHPDRMIVVQSGTPWGGGLPLNHKYDLLPEYIVFTSQLEADDTNHALAAGFFTSQWQLPAAVVTKAAATASATGAPATGAPATGVTAATRATEKTR